MLSMDVTYDPDKDAANRQKHGLSLRFGANVLADPNVLDFPDIRHDYGEDRWIAYGQPTVAFMSVYMSSATGTFELFR
jgi:hypothetical protein